MLQVTQPGSGRGGIRTWPQGTHSPAVPCRLLPPPAASCRPPRISLPRSPGVLDPQAGRCGERQREQAPGTGRLSWSEAVGTEPARPAPPRSGHWAALLGCRRLEDRRGVGDSGQTELSVSSRHRRGGEGRPSRPRQRISPEHPGLLPERGHQMAVNPTGTEAELKPERPPEQLAGGGGAQCTRGRPLRPARPRAPGPAAGWAGPPGMTLSREAPAPSSGQQGARGRRQAQWGCREEEGPEPRAHPGGAPRRGEAGRTEAPAASVWGARLPACLPAAGQPEPHAGAPWGWAPAPGLGPGLRRTQGHRDPCPSRALRGPGLLLSEGPCPSCRRGARGRSSGRMGLSSPPPRGAFTSLSPTVEPRESAR